MTTVIITERNLEEEIKKDEAEIKAIEDFYVENAKFVPAITKFKKNLEVLTNIFGRFQITKL